MLCFDVSVGHAHKHKNTHKHTHTHTQTNTKKAKKISREWRVYILTSISVMWGPEGALRNTLNFQRNSLFIQQRKKLKGYPLAPDILVAL